MNNPHPVPKHLRDAVDATDNALFQIEGLIAALDVIEDSLSLPDNLSVEAKALRVIRPLLAEKISQVFDLRAAEWRALGGS